MKHARECREHLQMTQAELAEKVGLSQETISQYEIGTRTPNVDVARKIAKVLREPLDNIFFGKEISK